MNSIGQIDLQLLAKYDVPAPRYTSYPTVPYWDGDLKTEMWIQELTNATRAKDASFSIYIHIPYCETLCTFCGCNNSITKDHGREQPYVKRLQAEWESYRKSVPQLDEVPLSQIHLGGGTPTFLSAESLTELLSPILSTRRSQNFEASIEVDPRRTKVEQLQALRALGFNRISLGVQDVNLEVQRLINRIQPFEMTKQITQASREMGYHSVNFDLIYGLPKQTPESVAQMIEETIELRPDRIAFYAFAMVPWIRPAQRLFKDSDVPNGQAKRELYEAGRNLLLKAGYEEIGMDHFALPTDSLAMAAREHRLHRNFMGYTEVRTDILLGLGVSAISETPTCFHQNEKVLPVYERRVDSGEIPTLRGHRLTVEDQKSREQILKLMTEWEVSLNDKTQVEDLRAYLQTMIDDDLVIIENGKLHVTVRGRPFLRNVCMGLDLRLRRKAPQTKVFSQSI